MKLAGWIRAASIDFLIANHDSYPPRAKREHIMECISVDRRIDGIISFAMYFWIKFKNGRRLLCVSACSFACNDVQSLSNYPAIVVDMLRIRLVCLAL